MIDRAVILAGGGGKRLWPWTAPDRPKPLLPLGGGGRSLLAATLDRLAGLVPGERLEIQAAPALVSCLAGAEPRVDPAWLRSEPSARDTGPAIALAMARLLSAAADEVVAVLPADHRVEDEAAFRDALAIAGDAARAGRLVLLGVAPTRPASEFGYLELGSGGEGPRPVARFVEKPGREEAERLLASGTALWNAGIFVWTPRIFWQALERHAPELARAVGAFASGRDPRAWGRADARSIDYLLMERVDDAVAVPCAAGWSDVGSWVAVAELARREDAGPARLVAARGPAAADSIVLAIGERAIDPALLLAEEPQIVVAGPEGLLVSPRDGLGGLKRLV